MTMRTAIQTVSAGLVIALAAATAIAEPDAQGQAKSKTTDANKPGQKQQASPDARFDPVVRKIEGWTVHVQPSLIDGEHKAVGQRALKLLKNHLTRISILLPSEHLARMQKLEIWLEHKHPELGNMQYHPDVGWLKDRGYDARLVKKVHIPQANHLFSRHTMVKQPWVILHELAHAYHDQHLGFDDPDILKAYQAVKKAGIYENVLLYNGQKTKHYALTDHKEYFAESTEAYLGRNDFYPFVRAELKRHDPRMHALMKKIWGPVQ
jgi:dipeptidyl-peptidase-4